ncbi:late competence protein ComER [Bacillus taeanensis]|uniref:Pyrroline-5-carboxylate reductase n=1 Tax=Bacillus taeanensis TaxID=273032 RepID=A0A366XWF3_9BACI|nr:late competence protein ComER [Bacillus taeanensis]RBW70482.1 late competence protein ComER [Bacillus taeanensis]
MKVGIIGTGNMGGILIHSFIESEAVKSSNMIITNRTLAKAQKFQKKYSSLHIAGSAAKVAETADIIFICVKPREFYPLLHEIKRYLSANKVLISITSPITIDDLESIVSCQVARVVPSITNRTLSGCSLVTFGRNCSEVTKHKLEHLCSYISTPIQVEDKNIRAASDIASCGPAFFSFLLQRFIDGAVKQTDISKEQATRLTSEMIIGIAKLLENNVYSLQTLQEKVCVKGGVTGEGIKVLEEELGEIFEHVFEATHKKFKEDRENIIAQFYK